MDAERPERASVPENVVADAKDRVRFGVAIAKTDLLDRLTQQGARFMRS
jgi:hypothetical protein